jgi:5'-nucleotidase (lipoprotein e(P4) family)
MADNGGQKMSLLKSLSICIILFIGFSNAACCQNSDAEKTIQLLPAGPAWGALWQQRAAEYRALTYQAYNLAKLRLDETLASKRNKPWAIITDIDETVLDNSPYFVREAAKGKSYADSSWVKWTAEVRCDTVPGAYSFLKYAASKGVIIFYITNRFQIEQQATLKNLQKFNLPNADDAHLFLLNTESSSKENRRQQITKSYDIELLLGDNLGDFSSVFDGLSYQQRTQQADKVQQEFGKRFIVFPNAMYGGWEDKLYLNGDTTEKAKNSVLNRLLIRKD